MREGPDLTGLIRRAQAGDSGAAEALFAATYPALRRLARARLRASGRSTLLDTSSLVHEWYLRFVRTSRVRLEDRAHFMRYAGRAMRAVIVDFARRSRAERRGGDRPARQRTAVAAAEGAVAAAEQILRVHEALDDLGKLEPRMAQVVELRYFAGFTESEISTVLDVAERTVRRDWEKARLLLADSLA
ncbi:MAG TPA: ECF-type sigma factor [Anaeromyxobacteraceae bacterium]|jgi:RNA polymerase sigma factor (TIGR02999 family)